MTQHLREQWRRLATIVPSEFLPTVGVVEGQRLYRGQPVSTKNSDRGYPAATPHGLFMKRLQSDLAAAFEQFGILGQIGNNWSTDPETARGFGTTEDPYHEGLIFELEGWTWSDLPPEWADPSVWDMRPWSQEHEIRFKPGWHPRLDQIKAVTVVRNAYDSGIRITAASSSISAADVVVGQVIRFRPIASTNRVTLLVDYRNPAQDFPGGCAIGGRYCVVNADGSVSTRGNQRFPLVRCDAEVEVLRDA